MGCVYKAENNKNGKIYIGKTVKGLGYRKREHLYHTHYHNGECQKYFHRAIEKYGADSFSWTVLYESNNNEELCAKEVEYIKQYCSHGPKGYNLTDVGEGTTWYKYTETQSKKMSEIQKVVSSDENRKASMSKRILKYRAEHPEHKDILADALRAKLKESWADPEYRQWQHDRSMGGNNPAAVKIMCSETQEIFGCIREAAQRYKRSDSSIREVLDRPDRKSAGLHWVRI